jgi:hypothetical protein
VFRKSSFSRLFIKAMKEVLARCLDPEVMVTPIIFHMNKPAKEVLQEIQDNGLGAVNNDKSVVSVMLGKEASIPLRRSTLIIMVFEEFPSNEAPAQLELASMLVEHLDRRYNASKRRSSIISLFISNYPLNQAALQFFHSSRLWKDLAIYEFNRMDDALLNQLICFRFNQSVCRYRTTTAANSGDEISFNISYSDAFLVHMQNDMRKVNRFVDTIAFWCMSYCPWMRRVSLIYKEEQVTAQVDSGSESSLMMTINFALLSTSGIYFPRASDLPKELILLFDIALASCPTDREVAMSMAVALLYLFQQVLIPTVVCMRTAGLLAPFHKIIQESAAVLGHEIIQLSFDLRIWKVRRSLVDHPSTKNIRDEILREKAMHPAAFIIINLHLVGNSSEDIREEEYGIRDLIEELPSSTTFSTEQSAMRKDRLLFILAFR